MNQIGKFQPIKMLGRGASATVYLALDTFSGNEVALKVLDPEVVQSQDFDRSMVMQFMTEASLAGKLAHPHIVSILEASVNASSGYIALEYVPGGDLFQYTAPGNLLSPEDAIQVAFKCCGALDYAFRQGIVHRDIKPANIMVVSGTNIKVADFGAAYLRTEGSAQSGTIGSPSYMSPEQVQGKLLDYRSDMFTLGVVLYQLFTAQRPFAASTLEGLFEKICVELPAPPSALRPEFSKDIDGILQRMMAKNPEERYSSWADVALDIAKVGHLSVYERAILDSEKFFAMKQMRLLNQLDDADLWELVHAGKWSRVPPRVVILREGEYGKSLFFLGSGHAKVTRQGRLLNVLDAGECVGELAYIKGGGILRQATVETMADVLLVEFEQEMLARASLKCIHQLSLALMHSLVDRLSLADERLVGAG